MLLCKLFLLLLELPDIANFIIYLLQFKVKLGSSIIVQLFACSYFVAYTTCWWLLHDLSRFFAFIIFVHLFLVGRIHFVLEHDLIFILLPL